MEREITAFDVDDCYEIYKHGRSLNELSKSLAIASTTLKELFVSAGFRTRSKSECMLVGWRGRKDFVSDEEIRKLHAMHLDGKTSVELAPLVGMHHAALRTRWKKMGLPVRTISETSKLNWTRYSPSKRAHVVKAAHDAARGREQTIAERKMRAATNFERQLHVGPHEKIFAAFLDKHKVEYVQQFPLWTYNLDFLVGTTAIEVVSGGGNKGVNKRRKERRHMVLAKYNLVEIVLGTWHEPRRVTIDCVKTALRWMRSLQESSGNYIRIHATGRAFRPQ